MEVKINDCHEAKKIIHKQIIIQLGGIIDSYLPTRLANCNMTT